MVFSRTLIVVRRNAGDLKTAPFLSTTHSGQSACERYDVMLKSSKPDPCSLFHTLAGKVKARKE